MKNIDYSYLCTVIGNLTGIPLRVYRNERQIFYYSLVSLPKDPMNLYKKEIFSVTADVGYFITPYFDYYGIVNATPYKIIVGPSRQVSSSERDIREIAFKCDIPPDEVEDFIAGMKGIVQMPLESIMQIMCTMNYVMNDEKLGLGDITIYDAEQENIKDKLERERAIQDFNSDLSAIQPQQAVHNTLALEQTIMNIIRKGDTASLKEWISTAPAVRSGVLAADQIRQLKNTFIVTATLAARAAIRGGMDADDSLSLSDSYIQKDELLNNMERIFNLQYHMVLDYTERVEKIRMGKAPSKLIVDVSNYIQHHLSEAITTEKIAKALFISRSRLSTKFKAETGDTLVDFILKEKTEEAKRLLRYLDKSLASIGSYLGFSSQSHFSRVFKKYSNYTPNEYREKYSG